MSQTTAEENIVKMQAWVDLMQAKNWEKFIQGEHFHYRGELSKGKIRKASGVGENALKKDNPRVIAIYDEFAAKAYKEFPGVLELKIKVSNADKYHAAVDNLFITGKKFPISEDGDIDYPQLAKICAIPVNSLISPSIAYFLKKDVLRIGTEVSEGKTVEQMMEQKNTVTSRELNKARKDLAVEIEKNVGLTEQIVKLQKENRQFKHQSVEQRESLEYMLDSGRRYSL
jgi:hypothetical protein